MRLVVIPSSFNIQMHINPEKIVSFNLSSELVSTEYSYISIRMEGTDSYITTSSFPYTKRGEALSDFIEAISDPTPGIRYWTGDYDE